MEYFLKHSLLIFIIVEVDSMHKIRDICIGAETVSKVRGHVSSGAKRRKIFKKVPLHF